MNAILGKGVYSIAEAARLANLRPARVREWFRGRPTASNRRPVFVGDYEPIGSDIAISFLDLIDVFVAGQLREHGVSMQNVRRVYNRLAADLQVAHAFCHRELLTAGKTVLMRGLDEAGAEQLIEVLTRQRVFPEIINPFLHQIDYDQLQLIARRWRIADQVVVDPQMSFGKPIVEEVGIPTRILADAYHGNNRDSETVAEWFNVRPEQVLAAVEFEGRLAA